MGDELSASLDGELPGSFRDGTLTNAGAVAAASAAGAVFFRDVVFVPLDQPATKARKPCSGSRGVLSAKHRKLILGTRTSSSDFRIILAAVP